MTTRYVATLACPACKTPFDAPTSYTYDPGVHTFSNGDPGYPPTEEVEVELPPTCPNEACGHGKDPWSESEVDAFYAEAALQVPVADEPDYGGDDAD